MQLRLFEQLAFENDCISKDLSRKTLVYYLIKASIYFPYAVRKRLILEHSANIQAKQ